MIVVADHTHKACASAIGARFQETSQAVKVAVRLNEANFRDQRLRVNQFVEWHVVEIELT